MVALPSLSQSVINGIVVTAGKGLPLQGASVFINGSSLGTATATDGSFVLRIPESGSFEIIVSFTGYNTLNYKVSATEIPRKVRFELDEKIDEMQSVIVEPADKNGWQKWGDTFLKNFIGQSELAENCVLRNPGIIKFRFNKTTRQLKADAPEALIIENRSLGYTIRYQLELFNLNFSTSVLTNAGYQVFTPMEPKNARQKARWIAARKEAYYGSMVHFIRSAYKNQVQQEGFEVRRLKKVKIKDSVMLSAISFSSLRNKTIVNTPDTSSVKKYRYTYKSFDMLDKNLLPDTAFVKPDSACDCKYLDFPDYLQVTYTREKEKRAYADQQFRRNTGFQISLLWLVNSVPVVIQANGLYFDPLELFTTEYWAWEKLAEMLPSDYEPGE